jgi:hypothetical protein
MVELSEVQWVEQLSRVADGERIELERLNRHYEGTQPLAYMHPELIAELEDRVQQVVINWPRLVVDGLEERLDIEGFRYSDDATAAEDLWAIWQANGLDHGSQQAHLDALVMRRAFVVVGPGEDEAVPRVTVESPLQMSADFDPQTRKVRAALKRWRESGVTMATVGAATEEYASLYRPMSTVRFKRAPGAGWVVVDRDDHNLGRSPVVVLANRGRLLNPWGVSELQDIIPLSDAACKIATDMMVSAEFHAMPRRWALGFDDSDFQDEQGNKVSTWSKIAGRIWASAKSKLEGADVGTFPEADLRNFHETLNQLARLVSGIGALPPHELGFSTDNPASADAIRSAGERRTKRAERRQRAWGEGWEDTQRLVLRVRDGGYDPRAVLLETMWRDASTPTVAQKADAAVKLHADGIVPTEQTREDLGYSAEQRKRMREMDREAAMDPVTASLLRGVPDATSAAPDAAGG